MFRMPHASHDAESLILVTSWSSLLQLVYRGSIKTDGLAGVPRLSKFLLVFILDVAT